MSGFDRSDFDAYVAQKASKRINGSRLALEQLQQAQVRMENLTGDPDWDLFLSYIEAGIQRTEREAVAHLDQLRNPATVNVDEIMQLKLASHGCQERINAWRSVLELPKDIRSSGEQAKTLLERVDEE